MFRTPLIVASLATLTLAACGDTIGEQAALGGAAGVGAAVITNGNPVTGALIGGAANVVYCKANPSKCS